MKHMPAEWEEHQATWLAWPHNQSHWPGMDLDVVRETYAEMIRALIQSECVNILVNDPILYGHVRYFFRERKIPWEQVEFHHIRTDSSWIRDCGPIFVSVAGAPERFWVTDWGFNGWAKEYPPWDKDNEVPERIAAALRVCRIDLNDVVLEGGAIEVNGRGVLLTVEGCLNHPKRNPKKTKQNLEYSFHEYLGIVKTVWLPRSLPNDHTGHVDNLARFVSERVILVACEDDPKDENYKILQENFQALELARDERGGRFVVHPLPMPEPVYYEYKGEKIRLPASYANFYIANGVVLVPTFECNRDEEALKIIKSFFPSRRVVGINCRDLLWGMGGIHCCTTQQPA